MELLSITEAADLCGKSIQTVRRMIKQRKIQVKKQKTPQGFNYMIIRASLEEHIPSSNRPSEAASSTPEQSVETNDSPTLATEREHRSLNTEDLLNFRGEVERFSTTIQQLVEQNARDKENFFGLVKTFQDRVVVLEGQIKALEEPKGSWWQFWK